VAVVVISTFSPRRDGKMEGASSIATLIRMRGCYIPRRAMRLALIYAI